MLSRDNENEMTVAAEKYNLSISDNEVYFIDIGRTLKILSQIRRDRVLSETSCSELLGSMNMLEDFAKTLSLRVGLEDEKENKVLSHVYNKIFWGNNLPAVTPEGESYSPLFLSNEIKIIRRYLRNLWAEVYGQIVLCERS